jgi:uncharacterized membrane protein
MKILVPTTSCTPSLLSTVCLILLFITLNMGQSSQDEKCVFHTYLASNDKTISKIKKVTAYFGGK